MLYHEIHLDMISCHIARRYLARVDVRRIRASGKRGEDGKNGARKEASAILTRSLSEGCSRAEVEGKMDLGRGEH